MGLDMLVGLLRGAAAAETALSMCSQFACVLNHDAHRPRARQARYARRKRCLLFRLQHGRPWAVPYCLAQRSGWSSSPPSTCASTSTSTRAATSTGAA